MFGAVKRTNPFGAARSPGSAAASPLGTSEGSLATGFGTASSASASSASDAAAGHRALNTAALSPYERTFALLREGSRAHAAAVQHAYAQAAALSSLEASASDAGGHMPRSALCNVCLRGIAGSSACQVCRCAACGDSCLRECELCHASACTLCSITNFDLRHDRLLCTPCDDEERARLYALKRAASAATSPILPLGRSTSHGSMGGHALTFAPSVASSEVDM